MHLLALLHRWTGAITGLLLAVIGLSGVLLVWEESWIGLPGADDPYISGPAELGRVVDAATAGERALSRITFADDNMGLHLAIYEDGGGAYLDQSARMVDSWESLWGRPELWLFDLHHYLFLGPAGEYVTGGLGLLLLAFSITGLILWWRTRKTFKFRLWPARMTRSAIIRQHRDIGVIAAPLLIFSALTGSLMIFQPLSEFLLRPWTDAQQAFVQVPELAGAPSAAPNWQAMLANAQARFPQAAPRRLQLPGDLGEPIVLRLKQESEWTPNGRTYVYFDPASAEVIAVDDPANGDTAQWIAEKFYPLHSAKVGGILWKLALTFSGLTLVLLGTFASWSFWFRRNVRRPGAQSGTPPLSAPLKT